MTYQTEFADFPAHDMPSIPEGFTDRSWRNDACPCFIHEASGIVLWIGYPDPAMRDWDGPRFVAQQLTEHDAEHGWQMGGGEIALFETDDWATAERSLPEFMVEGEVA